MKRGRIKTNLTNHRFLVENSLKASTVTSLSDLASQSKYGKVSRLSASGIPKFKEAFLAKSEEMNVLHDI